MKGLRDRKPSKKRDSNSKRPAQYSLNTDSEQGLRRLHGTAWIIANSCHSVNRTINQRQTLSYVARIDATSELIINKIDSNSPQNDLVKIMHE